jgi:hypothetical protein
MIFQDEKHPEVQKAMSLCKKEHSFMWNPSVDGLMSFKDWFDNFCGLFRFVVISRIGNGKAKSNHEEKKSICYDAFNDGFRMGAIFQRNLSDPTKKIKITSIEQEYTMEDAGLKLRAGDSYHGWKIYTLNNVCDCGGTIGCKGGQVNPRLGGCGCGD